MHSYRVILVIQNYKTLRQFIITGLAIIFCMNVITAQEKVLIERYAHSHLFGAVHQIFSDKSGKKWIASDKGVFTISNFNSAPISINTDSRALAFASNKKGDVWAAFDNNYIRNMKNGEFIKAPGSELKITEIKLFGPHLWVGTNKGILVFNSRTQKLIDHFKTSNSKLKSDYINFIHKDAYDVIWVGTEKGILRYYNKSWKKLYDSDMQFKVISENSDGRWVISNKEMYIIYDENRWQEIGLREDIHQGEINDMVLDYQGKIYIASDKLVRIDPYKDIIESYTDDVGLLSSKCLSLESDQYNHIYIGTGDAGLFRLRFADNEANQLIATPILVKPPSCAGMKDAELKVSVIGGTPPYRYKWNNHRIKGKNPRRLGAGTYVVTVTDLNKLESTVEITMEDPDPISIQIVDKTRITGLGKNDGSALASVKGGNGDYLYKWDNGDETALSVKLISGNHGITVTDKKGCQAVANVNIEREKFIPELDIAIIRVGQTLRINNLFFEADSSIISNISHDVLDEIYDFLVLNESVVIEIGGHTNSIPTHEYCDRLSSARAKKCSEYLYNRGITANRISFKGYGKRKPVASNESLAGRKRNQRVEVKIISIE